MKSNITKYKQNTAYAEFITLHTDCSNQKFGHPWHLDIYI